MSASAFAKGSYLEAKGDQRKKRGENVEWDKLETPIVQRVKRAIAREVKRSEKKNDGKSNTRKPGHEEGNGGTLGMSAA